MKQATDRVVAYELNLLKQRLKGKYGGKMSPDLALQAGKLDQDMQLLTQAWSEMARRNIMASMSRQLAALSAVVAVEAKPSCTSLKKRLDKLLGNHRPSRARYQNVFCLGYRVKVAGDSYNGLADDWQDMKQRCDDMKDAIRAAYQLAQPHNADGTMLKVFMAPEFFFRGRNGAYDHSDVSGQMPRAAGVGLAPVVAKQGIMELMKEEIDKDIYKDWLFVLGTAIAATKETETVCAQCNGAVDFVVDHGTGKSKPVCKTTPTHVGSKDKVLGAMVDNIAFVQKEREFYTVSKELVSHIDFVMDKGAGLENKVNLRGEQLDVRRHGTSSSYKAASGRPPKFQDERMGGSIFTIDGVTIGLEVCLDHAATIKSDTAGRLEHAANIQLLLIPSAGMTISSLRTVPGGVTFNVDGSTPHVQVVAGGPNPEIRDDQGDQQWLNTKGVDRDHAVAELETVVDANWKVPTTLHKVAHGPSGSILGYGPYTLA